MGGDEGEAGLQRHALHGVGAVVDRVSRGVLVVSVLVMLLAAALNPERFLLAVVADLLLLALAFLLHVALHESAHAVAAVLLRMNVPEVELGDGKPLLRFRIGSTRVHLGNFHGGTTHVEPRSPRMVRARLAVVTAAGPVSNLLVGAVTYWVFEPRWGTSSFAGSMVLVGVLTGALNLVPLRFRTRGSRIETDGMALVSLLRADRRLGPQVVAASRLGTAQRRHLAGLPVDPDTEAGPVDRSDPIVVGTEGTRRIFTGEYADAVALLREAVAMPQDDETRALSLNNLAWALVLSRPEGWLEEADLASAEALFLLPDTEAMMSTRGCVLVDLGEHERARPLLQQALTVEMAPRDRVVLCSHLLRAEHGMGNLYGAREALLDMADAGARPEEIAAHRTLLRSAEVDNALTNLVGEDGLIRWPEAGRSRGFARHLDEMREALQAFLSEADGDPREGAVRVALGE